MVAVVLCGIPGSGKSWFYRERFFDTHVRISRDLLRTPHRERVFLEACLETRQPFVVDKMNATAKDREPYITAARAAGFTVVAYWLDTPPRVAIARNSARTGRARVPIPAILGTLKRLQPPSEAEGFDAVHVVAYREPATAQPLPSPTEAGDELRTLPLPGLARPT